MNLNLMSQQVTRTKNIEETQKLAKELAQKMRGGEVILLYGNLGAGKTTFMQGFAQGLGIEQRIISPTFIIVRKYDGRSKIQDSRIKNLYHIDLYRTGSEADLEGIGMREILEDKNAVVAIEWPEKLGSFQPEKRIEITFTPTGENEREITINKI